MPAKRKVSRFFRDTYGPHPWVVEIDMAKVSGRWECAGIVVNNHPQAKESDIVPVGVADLRSIRLGDLIEHARRERIEEEKESLGGAEYHKRTIARLRRLQVIAKADGGSGRTGRRPLYTRAHFVDVAAIYLTARARGLAPTKAVADHWQVSHTTAAKWVARARNEYGLLAPTSRGKPAGETTRRRRR